MHDLRDAVRSLRSTPVVSLMAILSLALGIGANTAIFSILDSLFLRTLPVRDPHQLVMLRDAAGRRTFWSNPMWEQIRERERLFDGAFAWAGARFNLARSGQTEIVDGLWVSGRMFDLLGISPSSAARSPKLTTAAAAGRTGRSRSSATASGSAASTAPPTRSAVR